MPINYQKKYYERGVNTPSYSLNLTTPLSLNGATIQDEPMQRDDKASPLLSSSILHLSPNSATIQKKVHIGRMMLRGATMLDVEDALMLRYPQIPYL